MSKLGKVAIFATVFGLSTAALAETVTTRNGSDTFVAGEQVSETVDTGGDAFIAARTLNAGGTTAGDLHVSGFDVSVSANTLEDLYAAGFSVAIEGDVAEDLTAVGFSLRTGPSAMTEGNARMFGNTVTIEGPVAGALTVTGRDVILNAPVTGDVRILAQTLTFGPEAVITGALTYTTEDETDVPERVAPAARVTFEPFTGERIWEEWDEMGEDIPALPTFASVLFAFVITLLFFLALGALVLGFMPKRLARMSGSIASAPGRSLMLGVIGLSVLFGLVPITGLTIVGLPFVPVVILAIVVAWILGYALGAYSIAMRIWAGFGGADDPSHITRLLVFAAALIVVALLNYIPFVGWVANYTLVLLGTGAMTRALALSTLGNPDVAFGIDMKPTQD